MGLFGKRPETPRNESEGELAVLRTEFEQLAKQFRILREEVQESLERAYRHRKAAEARERTAREQGAAAEHLQAGAVADGPAAQPPAILRGARARRLLRQYAERNAGTNGIHS